MMDNNKRDREKATVRDPVQTRGIRTKEKIIKAGTALFSQRGYHNVTADEIARAAGVSVGTYYAYFMDKHDLFLAVLDDYIVQCNTLVIEGTNAFVSFEKVDISSNIMRMISLLVAVHRIAAPLLNEVLKMSLADEEVKRRLDEVDTRITALIEGALRRAGVEEKRVSAAAYVIYYASEGVIHELSLVQQRIDEQAVVLELTRLFDSYVKGLL